MMSSSASSAIAPTPTDAGQSSRADLSLWERLSFGTVRWAMAAVLACLGLTTVYRLGRMFGTLEWLIDYKRRRRFAARMQRVYPEGVSRRRIRRTCREFFMHSRCDKLFFLILDCLPRERAISLFSIERRELLDKALAGGGGVYIAMAHHGPHHVASTLMCLLGYKVAGVREGKESGLRRYVQQRYRLRFPEFAHMRTFFAGTYPRNIYRCLQEGYVLGSAMDVARPHAPNQRMEIVTIFGEQRRFLSGPLRIAIRSKVTVLPGFALPQGNFRYCLVLGEPLWRQPPAGDRRHNDVEDEEGAVRRVMAAYAAGVEKYVRRHPAHITRI